MSEPIISSGSEDFDFLWGDWDIRNDRLESVRVPTSVYVTRSR
jgi:hypothetical protein